MSNPVVVVDQGVEAIKATARPEWKTDPALRDSALLKSNLAMAQQTKAQNMILYLNSDRSRWQLGDENLVRAYLGLAPIADANVADDDELFGAETGPTATITQLPQREEPLF